MAKKIYINGRFLTQQMTGVQRVAEEITKELDNYSELSKQFDFVLLVPNNCKDVNLKCMEIKKIGGKGGYFWEQVTLPLFVKNNLLINFCNLGPILKRNQIVYIHDTAIFDAPKGFSTKFIFAYKFLWFFILRMSKKIITVSKFSKERLIHYYPFAEEKISFSHLGLDHINFQNKENADSLILSNYGLSKDNYFLAVGSDNPNKNFKILIELFNKKVISDYSLAIIGQSGNKVFKKNGEFENEKVKRLGYVSNSDLIELYKGAKFFLFPSKYEGFGLPPLEAFAIGTQPIVSNIEPMKEIFGNQVDYFDPDDYENLYETILKGIATNDDDINRNNSIVTRQKYSWEKTTNSLISVINDLIRE